MTEKDLKKIIRSYYCTYDQSIINKIPYADSLCIIFNSYRHAF